MSLGILLQVGAVPFTTSRRPMPRANNNIVLTPAQNQVIGEIMSVAAEAINEVVRRPALPQMTSISINTDLTVPPNSPSYESSNTTFEFPTEINGPQGLTSSSEEDGSEVRQPRKPRKLKRKRPLSFKKHRVVPKKADIDADDEASEEDFKENLELKLRLMAETEKFENSADEIDVDSPEKWSQIGVELRLIADKFGSPPEGAECKDLANPVQVSDLLSFVNLMLPFSMPQSLWSALLSYAAWKVFKKFQ